MAIPVLMPRQGQSVESCIIGRWYKSVGEEVHEGDLLFSYETDKSSFEEEAKTEGFLLAVFFDEGDEVPVLANVAVIGEKDEKADLFAPGNAKAIPEVKSDSLKEEKIEESPKVIEFDVAQEELDRRIRISPLAKKMAEQMGLHIQQLKGSGPQGRIIARDVIEANQAVRKIQAELKTASHQPVAKPAAPNILQSESDFEIKSIPNIRKLIATAMYQSLQNSAQLTHHLSADARQLLKLRKKYKQAYAEGTHSQNITINDLVCFAVIRALEKFPQVNSHYLGDKIKWFKKVHLEIGRAHV